MKIFLIGYMGSGKSTVGKLLAEQMKLNFLDFDQHIESEAGKTITEIFNTIGEERFRKLEHEHLKKLLGREDLVISLGGGTPCFHDNIALINNHGTSVYLEMDAATLVGRLSKTKKKRPLIRGLNETELKYFIETNLEKRMPVYMQAHIFVKADGQNPNELVEKIKNKIKIR